MAAAANSETDKFWRGRMRESGGGDILLLCRLVLYITQICFRAGRRQTGCIYVAQDAPVRFCIVGHKDHDEVGADGCLSRWRGHSEVLEPPMLDVAQRPKRYNPHRVHLSCFDRLILHSCQFSSDAGSQSEIGHTAPDGLDLDRRQRIPQRAGRLHP